MNAFGRAVVVAVCLLAVACEGDGQGSDGSSGPVTTISVVGDSEGELNLLSFAGYAEDGTSDPDYDWVHPFERSTGCDVHVRYVDSGAEIVRQLSREGDQVYDGASVSGDVSGLLIASRTVAAVAPSLFRHLDEVLAPLRESNAAHYVVDGQAFGTPAVYGPDLLLYDTRRFDAAPTSWASVFEPRGESVGKVAMIDSPMAIADAALYLAAHEPDLGITDPYELTPAQLDAATELLREQEPEVGLYWTSFTDLIDGFRDGDVVVGQGSPIALSLLQLDEGTFDAVAPVEGMTGWADTWMLAADAPHPNCMIRWMRWTLTPDVQAEMSLWYGGAPSNAKACNVIRRRLGDFAHLVDTLRFGRCGDEAFLSSLALWRVPTVACGDARGAVCAGYPAWLLRWSSLRD